MVVLAASICTRGGKPVISRQFRDMSRSRVEVLLSSFPKLISSHAQHTTVETDSVRYVYQPLEDLYMILITNKNSNILQDIDTLHLFSRLVTDMCGSAASYAPSAGALAAGASPGMYGAGGAFGGMGAGRYVGSGKVDERQVLRLSFELLGAFDEVIAMGYRENVNLMQIKNTLEMESHEEKIQEIIERNKEQEAKEELKRRAKQLEMQRREAARRGVPASNFGAQMAGGGAGGFGLAQQATAAVHRENLGAERAQTSTGSGAGGLAAKPFKGKGMQLGKKAKGSSLLGEAGAAAAASEAIAEAAAQAAASAQVPLPAEAAAAASGAGAGASTSTAVRTPSASAAAADPASLLPPIQREAVHLLVRERVSLQADRDGSVKSMEVKGDLEVRITDPALAKVKLALAPLPSGAAGLDDAAMGWKTHPHVDKAVWSADKVIALKDAKRSFPVNQTLGVLRWRNTMLGKDESNVPIAITCWPSPNAEGGAEVTIEFNTDALEASASDAVLRGVSLVIPLPSEDGVAIGDVSVGDAAVAEDGGAPALIWRLGDEVAAGESGSLEFTVPAGVDGEDVSAFFPVQVDFWSESTVAKVKVASVTSAADGSSVAFSQQSIVSPEAYHVG